MIGCSISNPWAICGPRLKFYLACTLWIVGYPADSPIFMTKNVLKLGSDRHKTYFVFGLHFYNQKCLEMRAKTFFYLVFSCLCSLKYLKNKPKIFFGIYFFAGLSLIWKTFTKSDLTIDTFFNGFVTIRSQMFGAWDELALGLSCIWTCTRAKFLIFCYSICTIFFF